MMTAGRGTRDGTRISHESIYEWIYAPSQVTQQRWQYLVRGHKKRRHKHGRHVHASHIPFRVSIHERPAVIDQRSKFGHWKSDTVLGSKTEHDGIHTEVERTNRYLIVHKIPDLTATTTATTQLTMFARLPAHAVLSVTLDNGAENHKHHLLNQLAIPVFFTDPYSA
jgi:IS30 family transposase